jgi:hypothetical protein
MFKVGDKVVCVDDYGYEESIQKGCIYTIESTNGKFDHICVYGSIYPFSKSRFKLLKSNKKLLLCS